MSCTFIRTKKHGKTVAIICKRTTCNHNDNGPIYILLNEEWKKKLDYFPCWMDAEQHIRHIYMQGYKITGESTSCSKCGKLHVHLTGL